ncbi:SNX11 protein, partial [Phainopepla nitens]|nr:SNX11 protein [Phainopepla nitens]
RIPGIPQELTTVRVQDPRVHHEGSWNSYVDYKIFLHGWGSGFRVQVLGLRVHYLGFRVWVQGSGFRVQGLGPVPELPGRGAFFVGSTDEFIERRRQGLQLFLER